MFGDESNNDSLSNNYRLTELKSMTKQLGSLDAEDQIQMAKFLFDLNIVDSSHLAAIPSALVYDYAPLILKDIIEPQLPSHTWAPMEMKSVVQRSTSIVSTNSFYQTSPRHWKLPNLFLTNFGRMM